MIFFDGYGSIGNFMDNSYNILGELYELSNVS